MTTAALGLGPVSAHVRGKLAALLDERRVVVWYDPDRAFARLVERLELSGCTVVSAAASGLQARRVAEAVYRRLDEDAGPNAGVSLLVYVPWARGATPEAQQADPFEVFARVGAAFGEGGAERLDSLARVALPDRGAEIERLFRDARPTLEMLDGLRTGELAPLVRQALGAESPAEAAVRLLASADAGDRLAAVSGAAAELQWLLHAEIGLPVGPTDWPQLRDRLALYLLASELHVDLPGGLPTSLAGVAHAEERHRDRVLQICDRWRETEDGREAYVARAGEVEAALNLPAVLGIDPPLGERDTFRIQEQARLRAIGVAVQTGDLARAGALLGTAERSPWRRDPERQLLWRAVGRCLEFLERAAESTRSRAPRAAGRRSTRWSSGTSRPTGSGSSIGPSASSSRPAPSAPRRTRSIPSSRPAASGIVRSSSRSRKRSRRRSSPGRGRPRASATRPRRSTESWPPRSRPAGRQPSSWSTPCATRWVATLPRRSRTSAGRPSRPRRTSCRRRRRAAWPP